MDVRKIQKFQVFMFTCTASVLAYLLPGTHLESEGEACEGMLSQNAEVIGCKTIFGTFAQVDAACSVWYHSRQGGHLGRPER